MQQKLSIDTSTPAGFGQCVCAVISGGTSAFLTCPIDVVKTRIQVGDVMGSSRMSYGEAVSSLLRHEGPTGLFRGAAARMFWLAPASALNVTLYQTFSSRLGCRGI